MPTPQPHNDVYNTTMDIYRGDPSVAEAIATDEKEEETDFSEEGICLRKGSTRRSSKREIVEPAGSCEAVFGRGGLIHAADGKTGGEGGRRTNLSGWSL